MSAEYILAVTLTMHAKSIYRKEVDLIIPLDILHELVDQPLTVVECHATTARLFLTSCASVYQDTELRYRRDASSPIS